MNKLQAPTEKHERQTNDQQNGGVQDFVQPTSSCSEETEKCEKGQLLLDEIEKLKFRRDKYLSEVEDLYSEMAPLEALLEDEEVIDANQLDQIRSLYNELKIKYDSRKHQASLENNRIIRREQLVNHKTLMTCYMEFMAKTKANEQQLNEKRDSLSSRLKQIQQQEAEDIAKARRAETDAANAYARAVAWGDNEGEKSADVHAQKAAKNLATVIEQSRRKHLIIGALEQELVTADQCIADAQKEYKTIELKALLLAHTLLEEKWNDAAKALLDIGGKLWASYNMIDRDQIGLLKLTIPEEGEHFGSWTWRELSERAIQYTIQDVLSA